jgi:hypothetical protein
VNLLEVLEAEDMVTKKKTTKQEMGTFYKEPKSNIHRRGAVSAI